MQELKSQDPLLDNPLRKLGINSTIVSMLSEEEILRLAAVIARHTLKLNCTVNETDSKEAEKRKKRDRNRILDAINDIKSPEELRHHIDVYKGTTFQDEHERGQELIAKLNDKNKLLEKRKNEFFLDRTQGRAITNVTFLPECKIKLIDVITAFNLNMPTNKAETRRFFETKLLVTKDGFLEGGVRLPSDELSPKKPSLSLVLESKRELPSSTLAKVLRHLKLTSTPQERCITDGTPNKQPFAEFTHFLSCKHDGDGIERLLADNIAGVEIYISAKISPSTKNKQVFLISQATQNYIGEIKVGDKITTGNITESYFIIEGLVTEIEEIKAQTNHPEKTVKTPRKRKK